MNSRAGNADANGIAENGIADRSRGRRKSPAETSEIEVLLTSGLQPDQTACSFRFGGPNLYVCDAFT